MRRRVRVVLWVVLALVAPLAMPTAAHAASSASLALSPPAVTFGQTQNASGVVQADAPCARGRTVDLQRRVPGTSAWEGFDSATSGSDGSFSLSFAPSSNADYRALVEPAVVAPTTCDQVASSVVHGLVYAAVHLSVGRR